MYNSYFKTRKTIRKYSNKSIPQGLLEELLESAMRAPTTGNMQLYSVVITREEENKAKLSAPHFNQPMIKGCQAVLTFCADFNRFIKWCEVSNAKPGYGNFQSFIAAMFDTTIYAQQFVTLAEMTGLGTCYIGTTTYNAKDIAEALNLPKYVIPLVTITVGYPENADDEPFVERLPLAAVAHNEEYKDYSAEAIRELYNEKENLECNKEFVRINNKESLAQVFTDIRYNEQNNTIFSKLFYDFVSEQGYKFPNE